MNGLACLLMMGEVVCYKVEKLIIYAANSQVICIVMLNARTKFEY